jgi:hypothetical protein
MPEPFEAMLTGGHPNSLGRTVEVVDLVLADPPCFAELFACYGSDDAVVRLRVSNAVKRVQAEQPGLLVPYIDKLIGDIGNLDQASAQWTLAQLFAKLAPEMDAQQRAGALAIMKRNLAEDDDWIVLNNTIETLCEWAKRDVDLMRWLLPHLKRLAKDKRKSVSGRPKKKLTLLT